jgi:hypothetical protein
MDVINLISKVDGLPDAPVTIPNNKYQDADALFVNGCLSRLDIPSIYTDLYFEGLVYTNISRK